MHVHIDGIFVALNDAITTPTWLIDCTLPKLSCQEVTVIGIGHQYPTHSMRIEHCSCLEHPFIAYLLSHRLLPLTFHSPRTALTFELLDHLDQVCTSLAFRSQYGFVVWCPSYCMVTTQSNRIQWWNPFSDSHIPC